MRRIKRKPVHFVFKAHSGGEEYHSKPIKKEIKTLVVEEVSGELINKQIKKEDIRKPFSFKGNLNFVTKKRLFLRALKKGKKVVYGETLLNYREKKILEDLSRKTERLKSISVEKPTVNNIKNYFIAFAKFNKFRHKLIQRTIKRVIRKKETPLEAQYGTAHSLLSRELRKEGIESSREITPLVFPWDIIVLRKLMSGIAPSRIKPIEYKKAYISDKGERWVVYGRKHNILYHKKIIEIITGKKYDQITDKDFRFYALVETTMLNRLSEKQVDKIIREADISLMFGFNSLPIPVRDNISHKEFHNKLISLLNKHSSFQKIYKQFKTIH